MQLYPAVVSISPRGYHPPMPVLCVSVLKWFMFLG